MVLTALLYQQFRSYSSWILIQKFSKFLTALQNAENFPEDNEITRPKEPFDLVRSDLLFLYLFHKP